MELKRELEKISGYRKPLKQRIHVHMIRGKGVVRQVKNGDGKVMDKGTWNRRVIWQDVEESKKLKKKGKKLLKRVGNRHWTMGTDTQQR